VKVLWLNISRMDRCSRDYYETIRIELEKICNITIVTKPIDEVKLGQAARMATDGIKYRDKIVSPSYANEFDVIVVDPVWAYLGEEWDNIHTPHATIMLDQHRICKKYFSIAWHQLGFELFITRYYNPTKILNPYIPSRNIAWLPLDIDPSIYKKYSDIPKKKEALLTGSIGNPYPLRMAIAEQCDNQEWFRSIPRPPEDGTRSWPVDEDYAKELAGATFGFSCTSKFGYVLKKAYEIPACGTILVQDVIPEMLRLGFKPWVNFLPLEKKSIPQQIERFFKRGDLKEIAEAGHALIHNNHTAKIRAGQLKYYLVDFLHNRGRHGN
jgi:hypothetical protein